MKKTIRILVFLLGGVIPVQSQLAGTDSLFEANELMFFSELERRSFVEFLEGKPDYLAMIASVNPRTSERELDLYRDWVDEIILEIRGKKFDGLNREKKIERIKKYVSKALLVSYKHKANFDDLFRFGEYNYFTAAAIYSFILDHLNIPYIIYEVPTHIYLVAFPGEENIMFETTRSGFQYFMFDHETRTNFVDFIHDQGIIDNITYTNTSTRTLFEQYYFAANGLGIREMIGMMYINSAVDLILTERTQESYAQLEKAFILYPSYKSQYMLLAQLNKFLVNIDYSNPLHLGYLIKASRLVGYGIRWETIEAYLSDIVNTVLVKNEDAEGFRYIYDYLQKYLNDNKLKENFRYLYLYESGRIEFNNTRYGKALDYLEPAYELRPGDEKLQDLLARALGGYSLVVSPSLTLEKIERYDTLYTGLADEGIYRLVKLQTFLALFGEAFQLQDSETGEKYMSEFENLMALYPEAEVDQILIGRSYSSAAIYYYRDGRIETSEKVIDQGLKYAPDNIELKLKRKAFQ